MSTGRRRRGSSLPTAQDWPTTLQLLLLLVGLLHPYAQAPVAQALTREPHPSTAASLISSNETAGTRLDEFVIHKQRPATSNNDLLNFSARSPLSALKYVKLSGNGPGQRFRHQQPLRPINSTLTLVNSQLGGQQPSPVAGSSTFTALQQGGSPTRDNGQHQQQQKRAGLLDKICIGTSNRLAKQHNNTDHYLNLAERYRNCTYVIGNLEITWLDRSVEPDLSFLESIREITGYLLIAHVEVEKIRMPNLQIIRGRDLFNIQSDQKEEFALILIENELRTLELPNLREILAGNVGSFNNMNLCHIRTITWDEIINWPMYRSVFVYNGTEPTECPACDSSCQDSCWGEGPEMCQKFSKIGCSPTCSQQNRCFGTAPSECCHPFCAGGCTGPKQTDCLACKNFYHDGECIQECPSMQRYNPSKFLWEPNPNGKYAFGGTCVKECPEHLLRDNGACVRTCPANKRSLNGECVTCLDSCPKNCQGVEVVNSENIDQLINCTVIEGSITILDSSFTGTEMNYAASGGNNNNSLSSAQEGHRYKPMHPSRLEVFKTLREITGYLNIQASHPEFKNLSYFRNLQYIGGRQKIDMFYALSIIKTSLVSLNLRSLRKVKSGKITIEDNRDLCFADTIDWLQTNITKREDITTRNNAEPTRCRLWGLQCHEQCARDGCWGPGPDECLSCKNYMLEDYCVENCTAHGAAGPQRSASAATPLSFDAGANTCKKCHPECSGGCNGTEALHCWQCLNVKDGPYCVAECPRHKYNNQGTCEECDKSCVDGCTGPSNRLGEGGCNSCGMAIINSTEPGPFVAHCIKPEEACPDGYYREYVSPLTESLLRSAPGKPVCRKCHPRCKSCTGMGTHVTVCDCAKYTAGEQCEDYCPRDSYANETTRQCLKCAQECNGCFGPTEADCISCRVYRIYYDAGGANQQQQQQLALINQQLPISSRLTAAIAGAALGDYATTTRYFTSSSSDNSNLMGANKQLKFNCTAQCPPDKPYRISESNMLDPYCSEVPGIDTENASPWATFGWCIVIIAAAIMVCTSLYRCQVEKDKTMELTKHLSGIIDGEPLKPSNMEPNLAPLISIKETELRKGRKLGEGFGGTVYQGYWYPEDQKRKQKQPVAIKVLRDNGSTNVNKDFLDEAYIMASVNHPNLVRLLAVCMTPTHLMLVTQLMPLGCLLEYVKKHRKNLKSKNLLEWCKQIARGMSYLEERRLVHRDLALRNVLLQNPGKALISDFGLAKFLEIDECEYQSGEGKLPIKWLAPECFRKRKFTHKSDVWAFGVTVWELLTFGQRPFEDYETKDVPIAIEKGARLQHPSHVSAEVYKVMYACWFYNPENRPNFRSLTQNFTNFARDPERYLICGTNKGSKYTADMLRGGVGGKDELDGRDQADCMEKDLNEEEDDEDYDSADAESLTDEEPPLTAMSTLPDLTPTTNNRMNEMFGFEMRHTAAHGHRHISESEAAHDQHHLNLKSHIGQMYDNQQLVGDEEVLMGQSPTAISHHHHLPQSTRGSSNLIVTDANNNKCWSIHHTMSTNSLGQKSEQPTDMYDYLLPSPCTDEQSHFSTFYTCPYDQQKINQSGTPSTSLGTSTIPKNPPHSAGLVCVNNEEYFLNYLSGQSSNGQQLDKSKQKLNNQQRKLMSTSNGNIPHSLV